MHQNSGDSFPTKLSISNKEESISQSLLLFPTLDPLHQQMIFVYSFFFMAESMQIWS